MLNNFLSTWGPGHGGVAFSLQNSFIHSAELMCVNKKRFIDEIWRGMFGSDNNLCAQALGVAPSQLLRFVHSEKSQPGPLFLSGLAVYCQNRGLDFWNYVYLAS